MHTSMAAPEVRPSDNRVVRFKAACGEAGISPSTMRRLVASGRGPRLVRPSERCLGVRRSDLDAWIASRLDEADRTMC